MTYADRIIESMEAVATADLQTYINGLAQLFEEIYFYASDTDDGDVGWSILLDLDNIPAEGLPWLAQFVGVKTVEGFTEEQQRDWIAAATNKTRGTVRAITEAAQLHLTGSKFVILREQQGGAYQLTIITRTTETPDSAQTLADILTQKPAGLVLTYSVLAGNDYELVFTNNATYLILFGKYVTYQGMLNDVPGT